MPSGSPCGEERAVAGEGAEHPKATANVGHRLVEIARILLAEFPIERVRVTVHKPGAVRHSRDVGVIIERSRDA